MLGRKGSIRYTRGRTAFSSECDVRPLSRKLRKAADAVKLTAEHQRYLRLLGIKGVPQGLEGLRQIVRQQLTRVPFENVSKLFRFRELGLRGIPGLDAYLDGIELCHFGGTCYSNNHHLNGLLRALGYNATLCAADMSRPDVHLANIVSLEGREYIVDAGYGAPFLEPLPRDLGHDHEIALGEERYVLRPRDGEGRSRLDLYRRGKRSHGYVLKPAPRQISEFGGVIEESFDPSSTFMNALVIVRFSERGALVLHNLKLIETEDGASRVERIPHPSQLPEVIEKRFEIPASVAADALRGLPLTEDPWGGAEGDLQ